MFDFNHTQPNPPPINPKVNLAKLDLFSNSNQNITDLNYNINPKQILDISTENLAKLRLISNLSQVNRINLVQLLESHTKVITNNYNYPITYKIICTEPNLAQPNIFLLN